MPTCSGPLSPGAWQTRADALRIASEFRAHPRDYEEFRVAGWASRSTCLPDRRRRWGPSWSPTSSRAAASPRPCRWWPRFALDIDRYFVNAVREVHGIDMTRHLARRARRPWPREYRCGRGWWLSGAWPSACRCAPMRSNRGAGISVTGLRVARVRRVTAGALAENGGARHPVFAHARRARSPPFTWREAFDPHAADRRLAAFSAPFDRELTSRLGTIFPSARSTSVSPSQAFEEISIPCRSPPC